MLTIEPSGQILGATIRGADLSQPLSESDTATILFAIGEYGFLRFQDQKLTPAQQLDFARVFGEPQLVKGGHIPEHPEMSVLSNIVKDGKLIGLPDAGVIYHRDMTYRPFPGFANILHAIKIPTRDGKPLGDTQFVDSKSAYDDLPADVKTEIEGATGVHTGERYVSIIKETITRQSLIKGHDKRHDNPPNRHPLVLTHPISGRKVLYCDTGHVAVIEGVADSAAMLQYLNDHQHQEKYQCNYSWTEGDVLMWDNLRSLHRGSFDYTDDEPRLIERCQILSDKITDQAWVKSVLARVPATV
jgi:taurine dioxygenase